jgi:flagellin
VAEVNVSDIQQAVSSLQSLAQQAAQPDVTEQARSQLNTQFQQVASQINQLALSANFNGRALLDGSLSGSGSLSLETVISGNSVAGGSGDLSIANLSTQGLFGGNLDISTIEGAGQSLTSLATAVDRLASVREDINVFQLALDYASANVDTVLANQVAAESAIREGEPVSANVQQNAGNAVAAQGTQLSPTLLQLIS